MSRKTYTVEQIIVKLREIEVFCGQGHTIAEAARQSSITEQTDYRWRKQYGGMGSEEANRLQMLEKKMSDGRKSLPTKRLILPF